MTEPPIKSYGASDRQTTDEPGWPGAGTTPPSPTSPADYAILEAAFAASLAGVVALARRRERQGAATITREEMVLLALATFALADVVAKEKVSTWIREPFVQESSDHKPVEPEGHGMRHAVGELLTCTRCLGTWGALGLIGLRTASPSTARVTIGCWQSPAPTTCCRRAFAC